MIKKREMHLNESNQKQHKDIAKIITGMRKLFLAMVFGLFFFGLSGCSLFDPEPEDFSGHGIKITLDDTFAETKSVLAPVFLASVDHLFMGLRETKSDSLSVNINSLRKYTEFVIDNAESSDGTIYESSGDNSYLYAYYSATVDEVEYGYMLVCMEGESHYYLMNFCCLHEKLDENKEKYISWANSIVVE